MPEGLGPAEVGKEIAEHSKHTAESHERRDRMIVGYSFDAETAVAVNSCCSCPTPTIVATVSRTGRRM